MTSNPLGAVTLPSTVQVVDGPGGLTKVVVCTASATAEVHLQGAHVTSWAPVGAAPVIWMSERSAFSPGVPLRGGVPLCFPWFGPPPSGDGPLHGFARTASWTLADALEQGDDVVLLLTLSHHDVPGTPAWPHAFEARCTLTVGATLTIALQVTNLDDEPVTYADALHTYLAVGDVRGVSITGLEQSGYVDRLVSPEWLEPSGQPLAISAETDRVYAQPGTIVVVDPVGGRSLGVTASGSANAVVWNPWIAKSAAMGDFGDDEWAAMVCVETCNALDGAVTLAPGESHTTTATIATSPLA
ncbi:MAG TPA: D-hexose-6-phosphate mutarotase [Actinotalea sp.]|nr:D-hexose-6-phosphate mutarotase [Actinotalea sp.]